MGSLLSLSRTASDGLSSYGAGNFSANGPVRGNFGAIVRMRRRPVGRPEPFDRPRPLLQRYRDHCRASLSIGDSGPFHNCGGIFCTFTTPWSSCRSRGSRDPSVDPSEGGRSVPRGVMSFISDGPAIEGGWCCSPMGRFCTEDGTLGVIAVPRKVCRSSIPRLTNR